MIKPNPFGKDQERHEVSALAQESLDHASTSPKQHRSGKLLSLRCPLAILLR
jgi:hypothetical protein